MTVALSVSFELTATLEIELFPMTSISTSSDWAKMADARRQQQ